MIQGKKTKKNKVKFMGLRTILKNKKEKLKAVGGRHEKGGGRNDNVFMIFSNRNFISYFRDQILFSGTSLPLSPQTWDLDYLFFFWILEFRNGASNTKRIALLHVIYLSKKIKILNVNSLFKGKAREKRERREGK